VPREIRTSISLAIAIVIGSAVIAAIELSPGAMEGGAVPLRDLPAPRGAFPEAEGRGDALPPDAAAPADATGASSADAPASEALAEPRPDETIAAPPLAVEESAGDDLGARAAGASGPTIAGQVIDAEGAPLAEASVVAEPEGAEAATGGRAATAATTDSSGRFSLSLPAASAPWTLVARHPDACAARLELGVVSADRSGVLIALSAGTFLDGSVHARDGTERASPVDGAAVRITALAEGSLDPVRVERTDDEGRFLFPGLAPGLFRIAVTAAERAQWERTIAIGPEGREISIELAAGSSLSGRVVAPGGRGLADARVAATAEGGVRRVAIADLRGEFALDHLGGDAAEVTASAPGHAERTIRVALPVAETVLIELAPAAECVGLVLAADSGVPLAGALVEAWPQGEGLAATAAPRRTLAGEDGLFRLDLDPRIGWRLRAAASGYEPEERELGGGAFQRFALLPGTALALRCRDESGEPVVHALVRLESGEGISLASDSTDAEGRVSFLAVPSGTERIRITHDRTLEATIARALLRSGREEVIELRRAGTVRGTLLHDAEIAGDLVLVAEDRTWQTWPDESGEFEFPGLAPGSYRLRYRARRELPWLEQVIHLASGASVETTVDARGGG